IIQALSPFEKHSFRVMYLGDVLLGLNEVLVSQGFHSVSGYHPMLPGDVVRFFSSEQEVRVYTRIEPSSILLGRWDLSKVRFWIVDPTVKAEVKRQLLAQPGIKLFKSFPTSGVEIFESSSVLPRVQLVSTYETAPSAETALASVNRHL